MSDPKITPDMTIKEAYEIMREHYPKSEYYMDMGEKSLYIGLDNLIGILKANEHNEEKDLTISLNGNGGC